MTAKRLNPKSGRRRNAPTKPLVQIYAEALKQPAYVAVIRMKAAYFLKKTEKGMDKTAAEACPNIEPPSKGAFSKFVAGETNALTVTAYRQFKQVERFVDSQLTSLDYQEISAKLSEIIQHQPERFIGTEAGQISETFKILSGNKSNDETKTSHMMAHAFLSKAGYNPDAIALLLGDQQKDRTIQTICNNLGNPAQMTEVFSTYLAEAAQRATAPAGHQL